MIDETDARLQIAKRLRMARELAGLSQGQAARQLGWHRPTLSQIEAGRRKVSAEDLSLLANLYTANIPWILGEEESQIASAKAMLAARKLSRLQDEDIDLLLNLISSLKTDEDN